LTPTSFSTTRTPSFNFQENNVLIPIEVLEEIDRFKRDATERGQNARTVARLLDGLRVKAG